MVSGSRPFFITIDTTAMAASPKGVRILAGMDRKVPQRGAPARESWWSVREQVPLAIALALAWLGVVLWWVLHGGCSGRTIDFNRASPLVAEFRVDLNAADWPEFAQLPGLGETLARRIVEYRAVHGPFRSVEDLRKVPGIGEKTLDRIATFLVIYADSRPTSSDGGTQNGVEKRL